MGFGMCHAFGWSFGLLHRQSSHYYRQLNIDISISSPSSSWHCWLLSFFFPFFFVSKIVFELNIARIDRLLGEGTRKAFGVIGAAPFIFVIFCFLTPFFFSAYANEKSIANFEIRMDQDEIFRRGLRCQPPFGVFIFQVLGRNLRYGKLFHR